MQLQKFDVRENWGGESLCLGNSFLSEYPFTKIIFICLFIHCPFSRCLKKYCECFKSGKHCGKHCTCTHCKNQESPQQSPSSPLWTDSTLLDISQNAKYVDEPFNESFIRDTDTQVTDDELIHILSSGGREMELSLNECDVHAIMESIAFSNDVSRDIIEREMQKVVALVAQKSVRNSTAKRKRDWMQNDSITTGSLPCFSTSKCNATPDKRPKISNNYSPAHENCDSAYLCDEHGIKLHQISRQKACVLGSDPKIASIYLDLPGVAPSHATIMCDGQKWLICGMLYFIGGIVKHVTNVQLFV